jgi:predicted negative regulator of RcsB-dependent stress response
MKKRFLSWYLLASVAALSVLLVGCSNPNVDTAKVRAAMQGINPAQMAVLDQALAAIDAGKYKDALMPLRQVAYNAKMDKKQAKVLEETIGKVRAKIAKEQSALPLRITPWRFANSMANIVFLD